MQTWSPVVIVLGKWLDLLKVTNSQNEMYEHKYEVLMNFLLQKEDDSEIKLTSFPRMPIATMIAATETKTHA